MKNQSTNHATTFGGFTLSSEQDFAMPANWPEVAKAIDNLAEYKVVELVLFVTYGNRQPDALVPLAIDDIMECTGLCRQSVRTGIDKALAHGYIERQVEYYQEDGNTYQIRYYGLKLSQAQEQDVVFGMEDDQDLGVGQEVSLPVEVALEADCYEEQDLSLSSNEFELSTQSYYSEDIFRIQEDDNLLDVEENTRSCPRSQLLSQDDNATLCSRIESLSNALGDVKHTGSNIVQARNILALYQAQGGNFEDFLLLLWDARDLARKKTNMRRPNRMPYFFSCLKRACAKSREQAVA